jgi:hypothetical protein
LTRPADPEAAITTEPGAAPRRAVGYTIVLPPGWRHIPVRRGTDEEIKKIARDVARQFAKGQSRDALTAYRIELERKLREVAGEARRKAATDMYVPLGLVHGIPVPASFLVSELSLGSVEDIDPARIIANLASADGDSRPVTVAGAVGARVERSARADPSKNVEYPSRRVDYVLAVPGDHDRYLAVAFSVVCAGDPDDAYVRLLVELFDAMMATWRWRWE